MPVRTERAPFATLKSEGSTTVKSVQCAIRRAQVCSYLCYWLISALQTFYHFSLIMLYTHF